MAMKDTFLLREGPEDMKYRERIQRLVQAMFRDADRATRADEKASLIRKYAADIDHALMMYSREVLKEEL